MHFFKKCIIFALVISATNKSSEQTITIVEPYETSHLPALRTIINDCPEYLSYEYIHQGTTEHFFEGQHYKTYVMRNKDSTIGFINLITNNTYISMHSYPHAGIIHLLGIKKEFQHKGHGTALLLYALGELEELKKKPIFVSVNENNDSAKKFYTKLGFTKKRSQYVNSTLHGIYCYDSN